MFSDWLNINLIQKNYEIIAAVDWKLVFPSKLNEFQFIMIIMVILHILLLFLSKYWPTNTPTTSFHTTSQSQSGRKVILMILWMSKGIWKSRINDEYLSLFRNFDYIFGSSINFFSYTIHSLYSNLIFPLE